MTRSQTRSLLAGVIAAGLTVGMAWPCAAQHGLPNAPPSTAPPSEPVLLHEPPPAPPPDFQGKPEQVTPQRRFNPAKTRRDAQQLAALAGKVPDEVDELSKGVLPKDLSRQLKEIQKLAKRLRGEIEP